MAQSLYNGFQMIHNLIKLRWIPEILKSIHLGNQRYSDILASIPFMSHTELNRKLSLLLEKNVIDKKEEDNKIEYKMLDFGEDLMHIFFHLEDLEIKYFQAKL